MLVLELEIHRQLPHIILTFDQFVEDFELGVLTVSFELFEALFILFLHGDYSFVHPPEVYFNVTLLFHDRFKRLWHAVWYIFPVFIQHVA